MATLPHTQTDPLVKDLLQEGGLRPAPLMLARTVKYRIKIIRAIHRENRHFRLLMGLGIVFLATLIGMAGLLSKNDLFREQLSRIFPGGMGYFDYLVTSTNQTILSTTAILLLLASLLLAIKRSINATTCRRNSKQI